MFAINRYHKHLVISTDSIMAMEAVTQFIYRVVPGTAYFIEIETFPSMTLYRFYIKSDAKFDRKLVELLKDDLKARHIALTEES